MSTHPTFKQLFLLRHPPVAVAPGLCYGASDVPLAEPPARHAAWLRAQLPADLPVFTSPLSRCRSLAECLAPPHCDPRLAEMDFGTWEMTYFDHIPREHIDAWARDPFGFRPPGGECGQEVATRSLAALADIAARHARALIVSHGGPLRCMIGHLLGMAPEAWLQLDLPPGTLCVLEQTDTSWRLARILRPDTANEHSDEDS